MNEEERKRERAELFGEPDPRPHRQWYAGDRALGNVLGSATLAAGLVLLLVLPPSSAVLGAGLLVIGGLWILAQAATALARRRRR